MPETQNYTPPPAFYQPPPNTQAVPAAAGGSKGNDQISRIVTALAAAAFGLCAFLPWIAIQGESANGFDVPMSFLWDKAASDGPDLAYLIIGIGGAGLLLALTGSSALRRLAGAAGVVTIGLFASQLSKILEGTGIGTRDSFGLALYVGLAAAIILASAPAPKSP